jgi:hypothetical protein
MVELHGGKLTVMSVQGEGSTFRATIPFHIDAESINKSVHSTSNHGTANVNDFQASLGPLLGRQLKVLVVDGMDVCAAFRSPFYYHQLVKTHAYILLSP